MALCRGKLGVFGPRKGNFGCILSLKSVVFCGFVEVLVGATEKHNTTSFANSIVLPEQNITSDSIHFSAFGSVDFPIKSLSVSLSKAPKS